MTQFDGYRLLACPLCHTIHAAINVVSFGFMETEHWSDSYSVYSLFESRQGLRQCTACHEFYLQSEAPYVGHLTSDQASHLVEPPPAYIPPFLRNKARSGVSAHNTDNDFPNARQSWIQQLKKWWRGQPHYQSLQQDTKDTQAEDEAQSKRYPRLKSANDEDLAGILDHQEKYSVSLIQATRILYWVYLNDAYRHTAKALTEKGQLPYSAFRPTEIQIDNMRTLLALLEFADGGSRAIPIAELHRELGQFDRAIDILQKVAEPCLKSETILEAASQGISAPIPVLYSYQKKK
jgi:hypothetical protein